MQRHDENGHAVAAYLAKHAKVQRVIYPGLESHPGHALNQRQARGAVR